MNKVSFFSFLKACLFAIARNIESFLSDKQACSFRNFSQLIRKRSSRFSICKSSKLFFVKDGKQIHYFSERNRGFSLYNEGVSRRGQLLAKSYFIDKIPLKKNDIVFDCGANYGDLLIFLGDKISLTNYYAFEPSKNEFRVLEMNCPGANLHNMGLGYKDKAMIFYEDSDNADSSFVEPITYNKKYEVKMITLDSFMKKNNIKKVKLLKLEAEGFEPEILLGAKQFLQLCEYIAIDGSHERGVTADQTFTDQVNILLGLDFLMEDINFSGCRALFRKK